MTKNLIFLQQASQMLCDTPKQGQFGFQPSATPVMEGIVNFHHDLFFFMIVIGTFVFWCLYQILINFSVLNKKYRWNVVQQTHNTLLEIIWTIIPVLILIAIAIPSVALLYAIEESPKSSVSVKIIGHQWYWSYEFGDYISTTDEGLIKGHINFDSFMVPTDQLTLYNEDTSLRLLEVDQQMYLPVKTHVRLLVTSADVIHSWAVPSLGIKIDACPGRLNLVKTFVKRPGTFYGQCSEICGVNHAFMPIAVHATTIENYSNWIFDKQNNN